MAVLNPSFLRELGLAKEEVYQFGRLRNTRNMAIHGMEPLDEDELKEASEETSVILDRIKALPPAVRAGKTEKGESKSEHS
jgi:hypothetical protein